MVLTSEERAALNKKIENPKAVVNCPRCGAAIEYHEYATAIRVNCPSDGCIQKTLRGI